MSRRRLASRAVFSIIPTAMSGATAATAPDLQMAFEATFGQPAPVIRHVERPLKDISQPGKTSGYDSPEMVLTPGRLVAIDGRRWALLIKEKAKTASYITQGAIAVAYLHRSDQGWKLEKLWPEIA